MSCPPAWQTGADEPAIWRNRNAGSEQKMDWIKETESQFLSAKDLGSGLDERVVSSVEDIEFPPESGTIRHVLKFGNNEKSMLLNKTNMRILIDALGRSEFTPEKLKGKKIFLMKQKVSFQGELVDGVRIVKVE